MHAKRPNACRDFFCAYRFGLLGAETRFRPDVLGIMFDVSAREVPGVPLLLTAFEVWEGAVEQRMAELHEICARGLVLYLVRGERRQFMGPDEQVKLCLEHSRKTLPLWVPR